LREVNRSGGQVEHPMHEVLNFRQVVMFEAIEREQELRGTL
jgi:hypothetical protein